MNRGNKIYLYELFISHAWYVDLQRLREHGCTVDDLIVISTEELQQLLIPVGFYKVRDNIGNDNNNSNSNNNSSNSDDNNNKNKNKDKIVIILIMKK